ncbi:MAG: hypothetical protein EOM64_03285 [Erysipelotrichia bacterium]|nr:hypothetical protein [Erysipelotrichia bacterium]
MMKYAYTQVDISPLQPMKPAGFIQQTVELNDQKDTLHARILMLDQEDTIFCLISSDSLGMAADMQERIKAYCETRYAKKAAVTNCCTHTHFAPSYKDTRYQEQYFTEVCTAIRDIKFHETDHLTYTFHREFYDGVGKSRISNHSTDLILLSLIELYDTDSRIGTIIDYNCHPTIHNGDTPYFTAEYPGYLLKQLQQKYSGEFFTFLQGPAGDVSTRFTRSAQDYEAMIELSDRLQKRIEEIRILPKEKKNALPFRFTSVDLPLNHALREIPLSDIPVNITPRELETIQVGQKVQAELAQHIDELPKQILLSVLCMGDLHIVFSPNELFSYYNSCIGDGDAVLSCYSNGYEAYVTDPNFKTITYESYTDTLTDETKEEYCKALKKLGAY